MFYIINYKKMKCSICKVEGHNKRSCKKIVVEVNYEKIKNEVKVTRNKVYKKEKDKKQKELKSNSDIIKNFFTKKTLMENNKNPKVTALEYLKEVLEKKEAQNGLIALYSQSQTECTRNGICGMEVGMSREKDQGAVLKLFLGDKINLEINNSLPEDFNILDKKISSKHSGSKVGTPVKVKWTSADISVKESINSIINADDMYYPNLLFTYLDIKNKKITIICITSEHNKNVIKTLKEDAFKIPNGNSRGIEYSKKAMAELLKERYFTIDIENADLKGGLNPIERRIQILKNIGINP